MSGRVGLNMADNVGALVLNVVLNLVLIPAYGAVGAAVSWSVALVVVNFAKAVQARRVVGVPAAGAGVRRSLAAAVPAAALAWLLTQWIDGWVTVVLLAAPAVVLVFFGTLVLMGVSPDDRAILTAMVRRLRPLGGTRASTARP